MNVSEGSSSFPSAGVHESMGYHLREIQTKGVFGQPSKIREEVEELEESLEQGNRIMALVELSDIYGALAGVAESLGTNMAELASMSAATQRAFTDGSRKPKSHEQRAKESVPGDMRLSEILETYEVNLVPRTNATCTDGRHRPESEGLGWCADCMKDLAPLLRHESDGDVEGSCADSACQPGVTCDEHTYDAAGIAEVRQAEEEAKGPRTKEAQVSQFTCPMCGREHSGVSCEFLDATGAPRHPELAALAQAEVRGYQRGLADGQRTNDAMSPSDIARRAKEAGHDALGLAFASVDEGGLALGQSTDSPSSWGSDPSVQIGDEVEVSNGPKLGGTDLWFVTSLDLQGDGHVQCGFAKADTSTCGAPSNTIVRRTGKRWSEEEREKIVAWTKEGEDFLREDARQRTESAAKDDDFWRKQCDEREHMGYLRGKHETIAEFARDVLALRKKPEKPSSQSVDDWTLAAKWIDEMGDAGIVGHYREPALRKSLVDLITSIRASYQPAQPSESASAEAEALMRAHGLDPRGRVELHEAIAALYQARRPVSEKGE